MGTRLISALDVKSFEEAEKFVNDLYPAVDVFKVGGILYTLEGPRVIKMIQDKGASVFLDLKFFDIPNTVKGVSYVATKLGVDMFTIHLLGGQEMVNGALKGVQEAVDDLHLQKSPLILGVTILTSMNDNILAEDLEIHKPVNKMVPQLALKGYQTGLRGFVCSPLEISLIKDELPDSVLVVPGIRMSGDAVGDQKRVTTPAQAKEAGADYIVMGRSLLNAENPREKALKVLEELA